MMYKEIQLYLALVLCSEDSRYVRPSKLASDHILDYETIESGDTETGLKQRQMGLSAGNLWRKVTDVYRKGRHELAGQRSNSAFSIGHSSVFMRPPCCSRFYSAVLKERTTQFLLIKLVEHQPFNWPVLFLRDITNDYHPLSWFWCMMSDNFVLVNFWQGTLTKHYKLKYMLSS